MDCAEYGSSEKPSYISSTKNELPFPTIPELVRHRCEDTPEKDFFVVYTISGERTSITYGELYSKSRQFASKLYELGIRKGDVVIVLLTNSIEWLITQYGVIMLGAIVLNSYASRRDFSDLDHVVKTSSPSAFLVQYDGEATNMQAEKIAKLSDGKPVIYVGENCPREAFLIFSELLGTDYQIEAIDRVHIDTDDPAVIMRSSGTTGRPKLLLWSHRGLLGMFQTFRKLANYSESGKRITNSDFGWIAGNPLMEFVSGGSGISCRELDLSKAMPEMISITQRESATLLFPNPEVYNRIVDMQPPPKFPKTLKTFIFGGSPTKSKWTRLLEYIPKGVGLYGCLEMGIISASLYDNERCDAIKDNAIGRPVDGVEVKIIDPVGKMVERNVTGNVQVRSQNKFLGFYGDDDMFKKLFSSSGWYNTGDVGFIDEDGQLYVVGRRQEAITYGSITTQASEIERTAISLNMNDIADLVVVPVPDDIYGQVNCFCVVKSAECEKSEEELQKAITDQIDDGGYKPHTLIYIDSIPYSANGKVERRKLVNTATNILGR